MDRIRTVSRLVRGMEQILDGRTRLEAVGRSGGYVSGIEWNQENRDNMA